jgi:hypothetical protein
MLLVGYFPPVYDELHSLDGEMHNAQEEDCTTHSDDEDDVNVDTQHLQGAIYDSFAELAHAAPLLRQRMTCYLVSDRESLTLYACLTV